jgi:hypothetical protein
MSPYSSFLLGVNFLTFNSLWTYVPATFAWTLSSCTSLYESVDDFVAYRPLGIVAILDETARPEPRLMLCTQLEIQAVTCVAELRSASAAVGVCASAHTALSFVDQGLLCLETKT